MTKKSRDRRKSYRGFKKHQCDDVTLYFSLIPELKEEKKQQLLSELPITWMMPIENKSGYYDSKTFC